MNLSFLISGVLVLLGGLVYLVVWIPRWNVSRKAVKMARALKSGEPVSEEALEYGAHLPIDSPIFATLCERIAEQPAVDVRGIALLTRFFSCTMISAENASLARRLAYALAEMPEVDMHRLEAENAATLLDTLINLDENEHRDEDRLVRSKLALSCEDVSPRAVAAHLFAWEHESEQGMPDPALTNLLHTYFLAREQLGDPDHRCLETQARLNIVVADLPPASLPNRLRAIVSAAGIYPYACAVQCAKTHSEFGANAFQPEHWRLWADSLLALVDGRWENYRAGDLSAVLPGLPWARRIEVFDRAAKAAPDQSDYVAGWAWSCLGACLPVEQAIPVYTAALERQIPVPDAYRAMVDYFVRHSDWPQVLAPARFLLCMHDDPNVRRCLVDAILRLNLPDEIDLFLPVFTENQRLPELNARLARHYLTKPALEGSDLDRILEVLQSNLPEQVTFDERQRLRERAALELVNNGEKTRALPLAESYLDQGGNNERLLNVYLESSTLMGGARKPSLLDTIALERLLAQNATRREHLHALSSLYRANGVSADQKRCLLECAERLWLAYPALNKMDCEVTNYLLSTMPTMDISIPATQAYVTALLEYRPDGWKAAALDRLRWLLERDAAPAGMLLKALGLLFAPDEKNEMHAWMVETVYHQEPARLSAALRLLNLYEAGIARPNDGQAERERKAFALREELARCFPTASYIDQQKIFSAVRPSLYDRATSGRLADSDLSLVLAAISCGVLNYDLAEREPLLAVGSVLEERNDARAVDIADWLDRQTGGGAEELFRLGQKFNRIREGDPRWREVLRRVNNDDASTYLIHDLQARTEWSDKDCEVAATHLAGQYRQQVAAVFVQNVAWGRCPEWNVLLLDLVDENLNLGDKQPAVLLALAERRHDRMNYPAALEALEKFEELSGTSEQVTQEILAVLPECAAYAGYEQKLGEYLNLYHNSPGILQRMMILAVDPRRYLPFELSLDILNTWADLPGQGADAAANAKCALYELYQQDLSADQRAGLLASIGRHSRQSLTPETAQRAFAAGEQALDATGYEPRLRSLYAGILAGAGELALAGAQYEALLDDQKHHAEAVRALESIAHQLEAPERELPTLLLAYQVLAEEANKLGEYPEAEAVLEKAMPHLVEQGWLVELPREQKQAVATVGDRILKLYQALLEAQQTQLSPKQRRTLADIYRLRKLWDKAGQQYHHLARILMSGKVGDEALEVADLVFDCYYKAGKGWWEPAARSLLTILTGRDGIPTSYDIHHFGHRQFDILEGIALLYHSLAVDPNLQFTVAVRQRYKQDALRLYDLFPLEYRNAHSHLIELPHDLQSVNPIILDPFSHSRKDRGETDLWTASQYERLDYLGGGEFADVYKVRRTNDNRIFAMKIIKPGKDAQAKERFQREGQWLQDLDHPYIVKCHETGVEEGRQYILMDFVDGQTLDSLILRRRREFSQERLIEMIYKICSAVEYLHQQGLMHRDLHPGNVLVGDGGAVIKLTDFGLATMMTRAGVGRSSRVHGRENYTPPEVYEAQPETPASEIFSLGAILCYMLTGYPRLDATSLNRPDRAGKLPIREVIEKAMRNEPEARYQHVTDLIQSLAAVTGISYTYTHILSTFSEKGFQRLFSDLREVARGEAGPVYSARMHSLFSDGPVAIKEIQSQQVRGSLERRLEQFYRLRGIQHDNLVGLKGLYRCDSRLYVVMEWVQGDSLMHHLEQADREGRRLPAEQALRWVVQAACGAGELHRHGIVHGCILPTNILVDEQSRARLSDFTAAVLLDHEQWHRSALVCDTAYYLAPEYNTGGDPTPRSDVYALGWLLSHLVTGRRGQLSEADLYDRLEASGRWTEVEMDRLVEVIQSATQLEPSKRAYADGSEFAKAVEGIR